MLIYSARQGLTHINCINFPILYIGRLEESNFNFSCVRLCNLDSPRQKWLNYLRSVENPDQTLHSAAFDLCPHC